MTWHEHLERIPAKGTITIASGSTSVISTFGDQVVQWQPILAFITAIVGVIFGALGILEKIELSRLRKESSRERRELHESVMMKQELEILELKSRYEQSIDINDNDND